MSPAITDVAESAKIALSDEAMTEATCLIENRLDVLEGFDPEARPEFAPLLEAIRSALLAYIHAAEAFRETPLDVARSLAAAPKDDIAEFPARMQRALDRMARSASQ